MREEREREEKQEDGGEGGGAICTNMHTIKMSLKAADSVISTNATQDVLVPWLKVFSLA